MRSDNETDSYNEHLRFVLGHFATGVAVVTAVAGEPVGLTIQAFCSLSLEPPLCPARSSTSWPRIEGAGSLCVNLLADSQGNLARRFALSGTDKFAGVAWSPSEVTGSPILEGALAWIDCQIEEIRGGGDHFVVLYRILALGAHTDARPPIFFRAGLEQMH